MIDINWWIVIPVALGGAVIVGLGLFLWLAIGMGRVWAETSRKISRHPEL